MVDIASQRLVDSLQELLADLSRHPYPRVSNPENCKRRASVALILRIRPKFGHWPVVASEDELAPGLDDFFAQDWVKYGDAEVAFIKRAARKGDRWTSHVALPGGKRDPEDKDDKAVAIRETREEIGLDLTSKHAIFVGNLPERIVSTSWGKIPLMVLCPFVFVWTTPSLPALNLQPGEIASVHWVPLRTLLSPSSRSYEYVDSTDRFARRGGSLAKNIISLFLGKMQFSAIRLQPSESSYCSSTDEFFPSEESIAKAARELTFTQKVHSWYLGDHARSSEQMRPLLLWGLTLGILADFLDQLPPYNAIQLWTYPTFTSPDVRWITSLLTMNLKRRNRDKLQGSSMANQTAGDAETEAVSTGSMSGKDDGSKRHKGSNVTKEYAVGVMLDGYYDMLTKGVAIATSLRLFGSLAFAWWVIRRYRSRRLLS